MLLAAVAAACWMTAACQSRTVIAENFAGPAIPAIRRVAVLPFQDMEQLYGQGVSFRCPLCQKSFIIGDVNPDGVDILTSRLTEMLRQREGLQVIPPDQSEMIRGTIRFNQPEDWSEMNAIIETGKVLEADAVVVGRVYRYEQRSGGQYAARTPASVSLDILLVGTEDGRLLWEGEFTETQEPLTENLLRIGSFLQRGGRWLTAEELAVNGMADLLKKFPAQ
jgi:hypothetical protein